MAAVAGTKGMPRAEREALILDAATSLFAERGFVATSLSDVAAAAGITKPLVYSYFGPKDDLFAACLARASANIVTHVEAALVDVAPGVDAAFVVLEAMFTALAPRPQDWSLLYDTTVPSGTAVAAKLRDHRRLVAAPAIIGVRQGALANGLTDADDITAATEVWLSVLSALVRWWLAHPDQTVQDMLARCHRMFTAITGQER
ncbi:TetR/AcrR family transcriptional regulator [Lentzea sp. NPDC051213]|uniref:TetR/AcrR family transcriptional regulator n=1 Tax=Lentzea sp. NPDC051213 TaxID=3364126 RepID=UPI0037B6DE3C